MELRGSNTTSKENGTKKDGMLTSSVIGPHGSPLPTTHAQILRPSDRPRYLRESRPERLRPIAARFNLEDDCALDNVLYTRSHNSEHQMELLDMVAGMFHQEAGIFKLLIVDSAIALFRVDFSGRGELADRQQKLAQYMARLQRISEEYNVAVFITNQMTSDPGATMSFQTVFLKIILRQSS
ncbi:meiotic recombination protein DMC1/LIM15 homolog [Diaphorina citri]|uniref:Meiotic recombination protein DMC1/LIM15 homolog n=1 Tax=Diaphorina citri TaxID=121845 RepID=A0A1S3CYW7_DIACI|nr:meiotic recombination protein DMC1/LIM15 homolog [Diaphorina citri]